MNITKLEQHLRRDRLTIEQHIEALQIILDVQADINEKEVYAPEPDDIDQEPTMRWTEPQLRSLREEAVVRIAQEMGLNVSIRDAKADTILTILKEQESLSGRNSAE